MPARIPLPCSPSDQLVITKYPHGIYARYGARPAFIPVRKNRSFVSNRPLTLRLPIGVLSRGEGSHPLYQTHSLAALRDLPVGALLCVTELGSFDRGSAYLYHNSPNVALSFPFPTTPPQNGETISLGILWSYYTIDWRD